MKRTRPVIPAKARPRAGARNPSSFDPWTPACAGVTDKAVPPVFLGIQPAGDKPPRYHRAAMQFGSACQPKGLQTMALRAPDRPCFDKLNTNGPASYYCLLLTATALEHPSLSATDRNCELFAYKRPIARLVPYSFGMRSSLTTSVAVRPYSSGVSSPASYASKCGRKTVPISPQVG